MAKAAPKTLDDKIQNILSYDRMDYTRGIPNRILAIEKLFEEHPEHVEKVQFTQIISSNENQKEELDKMDKLIKMVNSKFSTANWSPITWIYERHSQSEFAGLYR